MYSVHFRREREVKKNNLVSKMVLGMKKKRKKYLLFKGEDDAKVIQGTLYYINFIKFPIITLNCRKKIKKLFLDYLFVRRKMSGSTTKTV